MFCGNKKVTQSLKMDCVARNVKPKFDFTKLTKMKNRKIKSGRYSTISSFFSSVAIIFAMVMSVSCEDEVVEVKQDQHENLVENVLPNIEYDGRMLIFKSSEDYAKVVTNPEKEITEAFIAKTNALNFKSYLLKIETENIKGEENIIQDENLAAIVNEDGIVQIGDYIYRVNMLSKSVYVIPAIYITEYDDLVNENLTNKNIKEFSTEDDVIDIVEGNSEESDSKDCGGIASGEFQTDPNLIIQSGGATFLTATCVVKYFKAGIYFRLTQRGAYWPETLAETECIHLTLEVKSPEGWWIKRPCCNDCAYDKPSGSVMTSNTEYFLLYEYYSGARGLGGYYLFGRVKIDIIDFPGMSNLLNQYTSWVGRNINSPY